MTFAAHILHFIEHLRFPVKLPKDIEVMHPFNDAATMEVCRRFYNKFYTDTQQRTMIIGINPGRFGGGVTGIPFTDPIRLKQDCGIDNPWPAKQELSSVYIYEMIKAFGGPAKFYSQFYITAISPLGFTKDNKNLNYYDDKTLEEDIKPFVLDCFEKQFAFGINRGIAFCLGDGKNFKYLSKLNKEHKLFETVVPLSHPRFIMQYKLKKKEEYIQKYVEALNVISLEKKRR